jgi:hypothetical protein
MRTADSGGADAQLTKRIRGVLPRRLQLPTIFAKRCAVAIGRNRCRG